MTVVPGELPSRIGPYRPVAKLGEGGMGVVYRAVLADDPSRVVALKVILGEFSGDGDYARRFQRETRILKGLRHPNVVSVLDVGTDGGRLYFAMELLEGLALSSFVGQPWPETLPLLVQVCLGMEYLALRRIVHRDISPGNLLVVPSGRGRSVKVLDFGIAKEMEAKDTLASFTRTGLLMGKPSYWSPEHLGVLPQGETIDWRCDIYSTGIVFYYVLSGRLPIKADSPYAYAAAHMYHQPPPLEAPQGLPALPAPVAGIVARMLEKGREDRPQSWREVIRVLWEALSEEERRQAGLDSLPPPPIPSPSALSAVGLERMERDEPATLAPAAGPVDEGAEAVLPAPGPRRRAPALLAGAVVLLVAIAAGTYLFRSSRRAVGPAAPPGPTEGRATAPAAAAAPGEPQGRLALQALPWARVLGVTDEETGKAVPLPAETTTPVLLKLRPGRYRVDLSSGTSSQRREFRILVASTGVTRHAEEFKSPREAAARLDETALEGGKKE